MGSWWLEIMHCLNPYRVALMMMTMMYLVATRTLGSMHQITCSGVKPLQVLILQQPKTPGTTIWMSFLPGSVIHCFCFYPHKPLSCAMFQFRSLAVCSAYLIDRWADGVYKANLHGWQLVLFLPVHHVYWVDLQLLLLNVSLLKELIVDLFSYLERHSRYVLIRSPRQDARGSVVRALGGKNTPRTFLCISHGLVMHATSQAVIIMLLCIEKPIKHQNSVTENWNMHFVTVCLHEKQLQGSDTGLIHAQSHCWHQDCTIITYLSRSLWASRFQLNWPESTRLKNSPRYLPHRL